MECVDINSFISTTYDVVTQYPHIFRLPVSRKGVALHRILEVVTFLSRVVGELRRTKMRDQRTGQLTPSRERIREAAKVLFAERGYELSSTAAICRLAGTSESQLIKHFENKQGVLESVFQYAWEQINPAVRLATESIPPGRQKFQVLIEMVLTFLGKDEPLRKLF